MFHRYSDEKCTVPLTRAPENYCYAYRKIYFNHDDGKEAELDYEQVDCLEEVGELKDDWGTFIVIECLLFSIRSPYVALELNIDPKTGKPFKDLEMRKTRIANCGIEYK